AKYCGSACAGVEPMSRFAAIALPADVMTVAVPNAMALLLRWLLDGDGRRHEPPQELLGPERRHLQGVLVPVGYGSEVLDGAVLADDLRLDGAHLEWLVGVL